MKKKYKIKKNDPVLVISGKHKGTITEVDSFQGEDIVFLKNVFNKKHKKPDSKGSEGGIVNIPSPIHISNISYYDAANKIRSKIGYKVTDQDKIKKRFLKKNKKEL